MSQIITQDGSLVDAGESRPIRPGDIPDRRRPPTCSLSREGHHADAARPGGLRPLLLILRHALADATLEQELIERLSDAATDVGRCPDDLLVLAIVERALEDCP